MTSLQEVQTTGGQTMQLVPVETIQGEARVSSREIAARLGNAHKNVMSLIRDYEQEFEGHGRVAFETRPFETPGGTQNVTVCLLNERQCYFLLTLVRNSETTVPLKSALVTAFDEARRALAARPAPVLTPAHQLLLQAQMLVAQEERMAAIEARLNSTPISQFPEQEAVVYTLCQELGRVMPGGYRAAYRAFKAHFGAAGVPLAKYTSLPTSRFDEACGYLRGLIAEHSNGRLLGRGA